MGYFKTELGLWLFSLKTHRFVEPRKWFVRSLTAVGKTPIFVRKGTAWGWCHGLFAQVGRGGVNSRRLTKIDERLTKAEIHGGFGVACASEVAVKIKTRPVGPVDVWAVANLESRPFVFLYRQIDFTSKESDHKLMTFYPNYQGQGHAGSILAQSLPFYDKFGITRIKIVAGLSRGGAHWPKVGFVPEDDEFSQVATLIRKNLATMANDIRLLSIYKAQAGIALETLVDSILTERRSSWIWEIREIGRENKLLVYQGMSLGAALLSGSRWRGYLDLDDKVMVSKLTSYIAASAKS